MKDKIPLGPPPTGGIAAIEVAVKSKKGKWVWRSEKLNDKQKKRRAKWQQKMAKADKKGIWRF